MFLSFVILKSLEPRFLSHNQKVITKLNVSPSIKVFCEIVQAGISQQDQPHVQLLD